MASTKTRAAFLVFLAVCAYLISETGAHLKIGKKEFRPLRHDLRRVFQDRRKISFADDKNQFNRQRQHWKPRLEELPELYREQTLDD